MENKINRGNVVSSLIWKFLESGGTQGIQFILQIFLARLLLPEHYGLIALVMVFIKISNVFIQSGFNTALIQKKEVDDIDYSSVFFLVVCVAGLFYAILFFSAPLIAAFYYNEQLIPIIRVLSLTLFLGGLYSIQYAYIARRLQFKKLFYSSLSGITISGICGIAAAAMGFGVWSIVIQQLVNQAIVNSVLWMKNDWRPKFIFSLDRVKVLFSYGWKLLVSGLINQVFLELRALIIGRIYTPAMLGYYNRGNQFPQLIVSNIDGTLQSVLLPTLSSHQDDKSRVKEMVSKTIRISMFCIMPMLAGLALVAKPLISVLLTDKWLPAAPFLQIACAIYVLLPLHNTNLQAIKALGRSDIFLKLEVIKKSYSTVILIATIPFGIYALASGALVSGFISSIFNAYPNKKLLGYSYLEQWKDLLPTVVITTIMGICVYLVSFLNLSPLLMLMSQVIVGASVYIGISVAFKVESLSFLISVVKGLIHRKNPQ